MTTIYLVRHAEAEGNLYRIVQGHRDSALTERGWRQVRALERRFAGVPIDAVYSSDLYRARATASALSRPRGLRVVDVPDLREIRVGEWEELSFGEIARRDPVMLENFGKHMDLWRVAGAETPREVLQRAWTFLNRVAADCDGQTIALVSHGYILRLLLSHIEGMTLEETGAVAHGDNTAVSLITYDGGAFRLLYRDDNSHLKTPDYLRYEKPFQRRNALEKGLWYQELPADAPLLTELASEAVASLGRVFDAGRLLSGLSGRVTLGAYQGDAPVGLVQFAPDCGWISMLYMRPAFRCQGLGVQLLGPPVMRTRAAGGERVRAASPDAYASFFTEYGFTSRGPSGDGRTVWEKDIRLPPLS